MSDLMTREALIEHVECSPKAVAAQDRHAWLNLFADFAIVEDPVGSEPHIAGLYDRKTGCRGNGPVARFYDTFIAGNTVLFHVEADYVCGPYVMRDLDLEPGGLGRRVPMHLLYEMVEQRAGLRIKRLAAHWEVVPTDKQTEKSEASASSRNGGTGGAGAMLLKIFRIQGLMGTLRWFKCLFNVGAKGRAAAAGFFSALNRLQQGADVDRKEQLLALFSDDMRGISFPASAPPESIHEFIDRSLRFAPHKWLVSGSAVTCSVLMDDGERKTPGVVLFEINRRTSLIESVQFFFNQ